MSLPPLDCSFFFFPLFPGQIDVMTLNSRVTVMKMWIWVLVCSVLGNVTFQFGEKFPGLFFPEKIRVFSTFGKVWWEIIQGCRPRNGDSLVVIVLCACWEPFLTASLQVHLNQILSVLYTFLLFQTKSRNYLWGVCRSDPLRNQLRWERYCFAL